MHYTADLQITAGTLINVNIPLPTSLLPTLPLEGSATFKGILPEGTKEIATVTGSLTLNGFVLFSDIALAQFPIDLPSVLGSVLLFLEGPEVEVILTISSLSAAA